MFLEIGKLPKLLSVCCTSSTVLGTRNRAVNKTDQNSVFLANIQEEIIIGPRLWVGCEDKRDTTCKGVRTLPPGKPLFNKYLVK